MSSEYVRSQITQFLADNAPTETVVDLTGQFEDLRDLLGELEIQPDAPWLGLQFLAGDEEPVSVPATNDQGLYRETGTIQLHVCAAAAINAASGLLTRGTALRNLFRGRRIGNIVVESVTPMGFDVGTTLEFSAGYVSGTFTVSFYCDLNL